MAGFPPPVMVKTNGIELAVHELGPKDGIAVVLLHGFPDLAYTWRLQLPALAQAGYRVVAPDQRGYGRSSRPQAVEDYDMAHLTADMAGLLDALGIREAVFCGHDWGGFVAWSMPIAYPGRVRGVIGVNTPFFPKSPLDPISYLRATYGDEMYVVQFQKPGEADALLMEDVERTFRFFMRKNAMTRAEYDSAIPAIKALDLFAAMARDEKDWRGDPLLTPEEFKVYAGAYRGTGFTGGLNAYRNISRNWARRRADEKIEQPCLMVMAEDDFVLRPEMADGMEAHIPDLEKALIRGCGHWTQQEYPYRLNAIIIDWLKRHFI